MNIILKNNYYILSTIIISILIYFIIQVLLFREIIPYISSGELSHLGLLEGDSGLLHNYAIVLSNYLKHGDYSTFYLKLMDFTSIPINIKILSIFYFIFGQIPISIVFLNSIYLVISIICIYKLSLLFFHKITYSRVFLLIIISVLLFFPSLIFSFNSNGKEAITITCFLIFIVFFISILDKNFYFSIINFIGFSIMIFFLHLIRPHFSYMLFVITIVTLLFYTINFSKNKIIIIDLIKLSFSFFIIYLIITYLIQPHLINLNHIDPVTISRHIYEQKEIYNNPMYIIDNIYTPYIPNFIEDLYFRVLSIRNHFIQHSVSSGSINLISSDLNLSQITNFFIYIPKLMIESVFTPYPFAIKSSNTKDIFLILTNIEMIVFYLLFFSFLINFNKLKNYEIILIIFIFLACSFLLFVNPNIGTHYRLRQPFFIILIVLSVKNWIYILQKVYDGLIRKTLNNFNLSNRFVFKFLEKGLLNIFLILLFSLLIFFREILFINYIGINSNISIYLLTITFLSIVSNSLNIPLSDTLLTERKPDNYLLNFHNVNLVINLTLLIILFIIIFYLNSSNIFKLFDINYNVDIYFTFAFSSLLISIPINAIFASHLYLNNKSLITYFSQLIVPIVSLITVYFLRETITLKYVFLSIGVGIFLNTFILMTFAIINNFKFNFFHKYSFNFSKTNKFFKLFILCISLFIINSFILFSILYSSIFDINELPIVNIAFRFTLLINALISSIVTAMFLPFISVNNNSNKSLFAKSIFLFSFLFLVLFFIIFISLNNFINFYFDEYFNDQFSKANLYTIVSIFKLIPLTIIIGLLFKYFIIFKKENTFLVIITFYLFIYLLLLQFFNNLNILLMTNYLAVVYTACIISLILFIKISLNLRLIFIVVSLITLSFKFI